MGRTPCCTKEGMNKGAWTALEDKLLTDYIRTHGEGRWRDLPTKAGLKRCGKSCRLRWLNYLRPDIKRGNISEQEEDLIIRLHKLLGNRWSLIAGRLPGRTDNEIKNYWNTILLKKVKGTTRTSKLQSNQLCSSNDLDHEKSKKLQTTTDGTKRQSLKTEAKMSADRTHVVQRTSAVRTKASKCTNMTRTAVQPVSSHEGPILVQELENNSVGTNICDDIFHEKLQGFEFDFDLNFWELGNVDDQLGVDNDPHQRFDGKNTVFNDASDDWEWPSTS